MVCYSTGKIGKLLFTVPVLFLLLILACSGNVEDQAVGYPRNAKSITGQLWVTKTSADGTVDRGDRIELQYTVSWDDDSTEQISSQPEYMEVTAGQGELLAEVDSAIAGMKVREEKTLQLDGEDIFGKSTSRLRITLPLTDFPEDISIQKGDLVEFQDRNGKILPHRVIEVTGDSVVIDMNHPLAKKNLTVNLTVLRIINTL